MGTDAADTLNGTSTANVIWGLGGADLIDGKKGADIMVGGTGDDTYVVDNLGDRIVEHSGGGADAIQSYVAWTMEAHVESLFLRGSDDLWGCGNDQANTLTGNSGDNLLMGLAGDDVIDGRTGDDRLLGGSGDDLLIGGTGSDVFVFGKGDGRDVISDFGSTDRIEVSGYAGWISIFQLGSNVVITFSEADILTIEGRTIAKLPIHSFDFV